MITGGGRSKGDSAEGKKAGRLRREESAYIGEHEERERLELLITVFTIEMGEAKQNEISLTFSSKE